MGKPSVASPPKPPPPLRVADPALAEGFVRSASTAQTVPVSPMAPTEERIGAPVHQGTSALVPEEPTPRARGTVRRQQGPNAARIVAYMPEELGTRLTVHCAATRRTVSDGVAEAVRQWLERSGA